ncbi:BREX-2 system adenine-specific DNA-methyltransferase PglX [Streptosporangium sp. NPDC051022]|uniref:BREX-2 system adenine-specific DNA-methyltransferase PglX n=1 Tax=Streptosporangium sp. NPDC051022 TaxID=3155752 RepID=UPI003427C3AC
MIDRKVLLADLRKQVGTLEDDLRDCAEQDKKVDTELRREWERARTAERIAATFESWRDERVTQSAVAWVLGTVFLRYAEDNRLIDLPYLAGPGDRLDVAQERQGDFFRAHPDRTDRDWILAGFRAMASTPVVAGLFDFEHNAMWLIARPAGEGESGLSFDARWEATAARLAGPSHPVAQRLLGFWRETDADRQVRHDFTGEDTRFLGDLYQDLSEHAKKTYALLQTPEFVEEFILDYTLTPALEEFHEEFLKGEFRLIDPTCGSGHFLLGAFKRLLAQWEQDAPGANRWDLIARALKSVHGADKNPFAVAISRFRLLIAAMDAGSIKKLSEMPDFRLIVGVGDALLHGRGAAGIQGEIFVEEFTHATEDVARFTDDDLLGEGSYHSVIGNPPYIYVDDPRERENYKKSFPNCTGEFALSIPFVERFFQLAKRDDGSYSHSGYVGQITAKAFTQSKSGKPLIENYIPTIDLTHIIDTEGVRIPGHGTPTMILFGRKRWPRSKKIRVIKGLRSEPTVLENPERGVVWRSIIDLIDAPGSVCDWIAVQDSERTKFSTYPWRLSGGTAEEIMEFISTSHLKLEGFVTRIGFYGDTHADEAFSLPYSAGLNAREKFPIGRSTYRGENVRDWQKSRPGLFFFPYHNDKSAFKEEELPGGALSYYWPIRSSMWSRTTFTGQTYKENGRPWWEWHQLPRDQGAHRHAIVFAAIATHAHFLWDRGKDAYVRSAPIIRFPSSADENIFPSLINILNSSIATFWLRQTMPPKGGSGIGRGIQDEAWEERYTIDGGKLKAFPFPANLSPKLALAIDSLSQQANEVEPSVICAKSIPTRKQLDSGQTKYHRIRSRMISLQEELDWEVYKLYGLLDADEAAELCVENWAAGPGEPDEVPLLNLGERAFEIVLARKMTAGEIETQWFARHGSKPITELPEHWPAAYRKVVERRIECIERRRDIALIERPECKRRWAAEPYAKKEREALTAWLLDRCETKDLWYVQDDFGKPQPKPMTVNRLADKLRDDADVVGVARLLTTAIGLSPDADLADVLKTILADEHVPYLAALRYKDTGLRKRVQWERTWELQRQEDETGKRLNIPVPPKYASADFRPGFWKHRGKLDVPKERFVSYPGANSKTDDSMLLGWAGWDHRDQGYALMTLIEERADQDLWEKQELIPLIAGLHEVLPWIRQWHSEVDPDYGGSWADALTGYLDDQRHRYGLTDDDLTSWRPLMTGRGRKKA